LAVASLEGEPVGASTGDCAIRQRS
jgi:hypothetical protein